MFPTNNPFQPPVPPYTFFTAAPYPMPQPHFQQPIQTLPWTPFQHAGWQNPGYPFAPATVPRTVYLTVGQPSIRLPLLELTQPTPTLPHSHMFPQPNLPTHQPQMRAHHQYHPRQQPQPAIEKPNPLAQHATQIKEELEHLKTLWLNESPSLEQLTPSWKKTRLLKTVASIFELSTLLESSTNGIRLALKDAVLCTMLINAVFEETQIQLAEQMILKLIKPLFECTTPEAVKTAFDSAKYTTSNQDVNNQLIEKTIQNLIRKIGKTESAQKAKLENLYAHVDLLAFGIGQLVSNLPQGLSGRRLLPENLQETLTHVLNNTRVARNAVAHSKGGSSRDQMSLHKAGYELVLTIIERYSHSEPAAEAQRCETPSLTELPEPTAEQKKTVSRHQTSNQPAVSTPSKEEQAKAVEYSRKKTDLIRQVKTTQAMIESHTAYHQLPSYQALTTCLQTTSSQLTNETLPLKAIQRASNTLTDAMNVLLNAIQRQKDEEAREKARISHLKETAKKTENKRQEVLNLIQQFKNALTDTASTFEKYEQFREYSDVKQTMSKYEQIIRNWENHFQTLNDYDQFSELYQELNQRYMRDIPKKTWRQLSTELQLDIKTCEQKNRAELLEQQRQQNKLAQIEQKTRNEITKNLRILQNATEADCDQTTFSLKQVQQFCNAYLNDDDSSLPSKEAIEPYETLIKIITKRQQEEMNLNDKLTALSNKWETIASKLQQEETVERSRFSQFNKNKIIFGYWLQEKLALTEQDVDTLLHHPQNFPNLNTVLDLFYHTIKQPTDTLINSLISTFSTNIIETALNQSLHFSCPHGGAWDYQIEKEQEKLRTVFKCLYLLHHFNLHSDHLIADNILPILSDIDFTTSLPTGSARNITFFSQPANSESDVNLQDRLLFGGIMAIVQLWLYQPGKNNALFQRMASFNEVGLNPNSFTLIKKILFSMKNEQSMNCKALIHAYFTYTIIAHRHGGWVDNLYENAGELHAFINEHFQITLPTADTLHPLVQQSLKKLLTHVVKNALHTLERMKEYAIIQQPFNDNEIFTFFCSFYHSFLLLIDTFNLNPVTNNILSEQAIKSFIMECKFPSSHYPNFTINPETHMMVIGPSNQPSRLIDLLIHLCHHIKEKFPESREQLIPIYQYIKEKFPECRDQIDNELNRSNDHAGTFSI